ncbi:MAG: cytochrome c [Deltaproteobacteria bacterium]|nr:cytochrome c [Deltaproteobacteria bacterium]
MNPAFLVSSQRGAALLLGAACVVAACDRQQVAPSATESAPPGAAASATSDLPSPNACAPFEQLASMDTRRPVPLQPMMAWHQKQDMMDHLVAIQQITDALGREDWEGVASASGRIGLSPSMQQQCEHMGAGADGFTELALDFHRRADAIGVAAQAEDATAVLRATSNTLQACTSCHATYRQDIVDAATWQARTGSAP